MKGVIKIGPDRDGSQLLDLTSGDELFVGSWHRLAAAERVKEGSKRAAVERDHHKPDLHHQRLGSRPNIGCDEESEDRDQDEPEGDGAIDWLGASHRQGSIVTKSDPQSLGAK